jgi:hypothetical protein
MSAAALCIELKTLRYGFVSYDREIVQMPLKKAF